MRIDRCDRVMAACTCVRQIFLETRMFGRFEGMSESIEKRSWSFKNYMTLSSVLTQVDKARPSVSYACLHDDLITRTHSTCAST